MSLPGLTITSPHQKLIRHLPAPACGKGPGRHQRHPSGARGKNRPEWSTWVPGAGNLGRASLWASRQEGAAEPHTLTHTSCTCELSCPHTLVRVKHTVPLSPHAHTLTCTHTFTRTLAHSPLICTRPHDLTVGLVLHVPTLAPHWASSLDRAAQRGPTTAPELEDSLPAPPGQPDLLPGSAKRS